MSMIEGAITAMVTPFGPEGEIDEPALRRHIDEQVGAGVDGLLVIGGSGEFVSLDDAERRRVMAIAVEHVNRRVPVVVGLLAPGTRHVVELARQAGRAGADAVLVLPPYYISPSAAGIAEHFARVAGEGGLPIVVYNNPGRTRVNLDAEMMARLVEIDAVVAMKECDRDLGSVSEKIQAVGHRIAILAGDDDLAFPTLVLGARGGIWAGSNLAPAPYVEMYRAVVAGNIERARQIHYQLLPFVKAWYIANHPGPLKEAMALAGRPVGRARPPLQPMTADQMAAVRQALAGLGVPGRR
ncbi:MAG: 4-hydroxy-tetrahydrodipicolinate synthase [Chloroflexi bacterium]|nr:4-hydroxy-tetrahydrodipicolinate synthase [Chloroflexota bacterium]